MNYRTRELKAQIKWLEAEIAPELLPVLKAVTDSLEKFLDDAFASGHARSRKLSKERRIEIASNAAKARWPKKKS